jgi:HlyD family secretion protein
MKAKHWLVLAVILASIVGCGGEAVVVEPGAGRVADPATTPAAAAAVQSGVAILAEGVVQAVQPLLPLASETGGKLVAVHVAAGDQVEAGDPIATLDGVQVRDQVDQAQLSLQQAELALENLTRETDPAAEASAKANLASAQAGLASATSGLASARSSLAGLTRPPGEQQILAAQHNLRGAEQALQDLLDLPDPDVVQIARTNLTAAEMQLRAAQTAYDQVAHLDYAAMTGEALNLWQATVNYERAQAEYNEALEGATAEQLATARAGVALAQAELDALQEVPDPDALAAAEAQVTAAEAQVMAAEVQVESAQAALQKLLAGPPAGDVAAAENSVAQARLALESAQRALEAVELVAPAADTGAAWTVVAVEAAPGALVGAGSPIAALLDITHLEFHTLNLSERDLAQVFSGQAAVVTLKAYPNEPIQATVLRIGLQAGAPVGDAATFPVVLDLGETQLDLRPGMTGRVELRGGE